MSNTTIVCQTLDDIIKQADIPKIIVIGGGGLGKTTLVNKITNAKFDVSQTTSDGTIDFQGASIPHKGIDTLVVDSPGFRYNEDKWWDGIMRIKNVIGVILMYKYEHRNSGYGNFGYVLAYLNQQKNTQVKKFLLDHSANLDSENYMAGSIPVQHSGHDIIYQYVQEWIQQLDRNSKIDIFSPTALIKQYHNKLDDIHKLHTAMIDLEQKHKVAMSNHVRTNEQLQTQNKTLSEEKQSAERKLETLETMLKELPDELARYDDNSTGFVPDAPHAIHYLYAWLPFVGVAHLNSLRTKAEKNHSLAIRLLNKVRKKKED